MSPHVGLFTWSSRARQLLAVRVGIERRSLIFSAEKIDESVPRQTFLTGKCLVEGDKHSGPTERTIKIKLLLGQFYFFYLITL